MKLYRLIPDQFCNIRMVRFHPEEALYQLGYLAVTDHGSYFGYIDPLDRDYNPLYDEGGAGMFFYTNPWDAVHCSNSINGSKAIVRVHEYDFSDDIINKSIQGQGAGYNGIRFNEVKIPHSVIKNLDGYIETLTPQLIDEIYETNKKIYLSSQEAYRNSGIEETEKVIKTILLDEKKIELFHQKCIRNFLFAVKGSYITGKTFNINRVYDLGKGGWQDIDYLDLVDNSNDVLTYDNMPQELVELYDRHSNDNNNYKKLLEKIR